MNKSLATFMSLGITAVILAVLLIGVTYSSLADKNGEQQRTLRQEYNLQKK